MWEKVSPVSTVLRSGWLPVELSSICRWTAVITTRFWKFTMTLGWKRQYEQVSLVCNIFVIHRFIWSRHWHCHVTCQICTEHFQTTFSSMTPPNIVYWRLCIMFFWLMDTITKMLDTVRYDTSTIRSYLTFYPRIYIPFYFVVYLLGEFKKLFTFTLNNLLTMNSAS